MSYGTIELPSGKKLKDHHNIIRKSCKCRGKTFTDKELIKRQLEGK